VQSRAATCMHFAAVYPTSRWSAPPSPDAACKHHDWQQGGEILTICKAHNDINM
jgi:hypothetical protein